jgi:hypothetical protein
LYTVIKTYRRQCVQGNSLESDEVVAAGDCAGDGSSPAAVLLNHLASAPETRKNGSRDETSLIDLELHPGKNIKISPYVSVMIRNVEYILTHWSAVELTPLQVDPGH